MRAPAFEPVRPDGQTQAVAESAGWLDLLLAQEPTTRFETERARLVARHPELAEQVAHEHAVALQLQEQMAQLRRRETELAALYRTANDLTQVRDVDLVLEAIVARGQELLRCDVAYMSVVDEAVGDLYVRAASGPVSASFVGTRVRLGEGVGGRVADARRPYQAGNYGRDRDMQHTEVLDAIVTGEGMVTLLGVPLEIGGRLLGVLFAANRYERPFLPQEVALLSSLGAHAAVALENARLFSESSTALRELRAAYDVIQEQSAASERSADVHVAINNVMLHGEDVGAIAAAMTQVLGGAACVLDAEGRTPLGTSGSWPVGRALPKAVEAALTQAREAGHAHDLRASGESWLVTSVRAGSVVLGGLLMRRPEAFMAVEVRIFERAAQSIAVLLLAQQSVLQAERRNVDELLRELVEGGPDLSDERRDVAARRLRLHGLSGGPVILVLVHVDDAASATARALSALDRVTGEGRRGVAGAYGDALLVALPELDAARARQAVAAALNDSAMTGRTIVSSGPLPSAVDMSRGYRLAARAMRLLITLGRTGTECAAESLAMYGSLLTNSSPQDIDDFLHAQVGVLAEHDRGHGTALVQTLLAYLENGRSPRAAAAELHVHTNTVVQRMTRVDGLLGPDWRSPARSLELHVAVRLQSLRRELAPDD